MNGKDKISVIIPCYNVQKYIMRCFDSIYSQTYGFENLEVILIDDLSTDNTWSIDVYKRQLLYRQFFDRRPWPRHGLLPLPQIQTCNYSYSR